ncbi:MAG: carboxylating nicotinate-nucleotide diphosphorylase [bacterium]|nr:carboxylating nicotinate-nucleotide diphosphorylase [bacterium]
MQITEQVLLSTTNLTKLIELALLEDLYGGDCSSEVLKDGVIITANFLAKEAGVIAGLVLVPEIIKIAGTNNYLRSHLQFEPHVSEGAKVSNNTVIASICGDIKDILAIERTILNFVSRVSGIATYTSKMVDALAGAKPRIYDTRKTLPGWRILDKYAVYQGGGVNHRLNLSEHLMFKDNHYYGDKLGVLEYLKNLNKLQDSSQAKRVEIEVDNFSYFEHEEIWNADIIMLDNMNLKKLNEAIKIIRLKETAQKKYEIEISGGLNIDNLASLKNLDVDRISIGRITHSASSYDISLDCI